MQNFAVKWAEPKKCMKIVSEYDMLSLDRLIAIG